MKGRGAKPAQSLRSVLFGSAESSPPSAPLVAGSTPARPTNPLSSLRSLIEARRCFSGRFATKKVCESIGEAGALDFFGGYRPYFFQS
jgi:hypothetical protein